jgi:hypothetical protein
MPPEVISTCTVSCSVGARLRSTNEGQWLVASVPAVELQHSAASLGVLHGALTILPACLSADLHPSPWQVEAQAEFICDLLDKGLKRLTRLSKNGVDIAEKVSSLACFLICSHFCRYCQTAYVCFLPV